MKFRDAKPSDFAFVAEHSISRGCLDKQPLEVDFVYALEHEGNILGVGGVKLLNASTSWCWFDLTTFATSHMIVVYRVIRESLEKLAAEHGIRRMMAAVDCGFPEAIRTVKHLGFSRESVMHNFFDDRAAYMFVKFFGKEQ